MVSVQAKADWFKRTHDPSRPACCHSCSRYSLDSAATNGVVSVRQAGASEAATPNSKV